MSQVSILNNAIFPPGSSIDTLTGDAGGPIGPSLTNNINLVGGSNLNTSGNPVTNTITFNLDDTVSISGSFTAGTDIQSTAGNVIILSGSLTLPSTTATDGQIIVNGARWAHSFGTLNTFVGSSSGNLTTTGDENVGFGGNTLQDLGAATGNTAVGFNALMNVTTGSSNTALGADALANLLTGSDNIAVGLSAGTNYTGAEDANILIGNDGVVGDSETIRIGTLGDQTSTFIQGIASVVVGNKHYVTIDTTTGEMGSDTGPVSGVTSLEGDSGGPLTGALTLAGGNNISTSGALSTITIDVTGTVDHAIQLGNATGSLTSFSLGTANQVLQSGGAAADPVWSTATYPATTAQGDIIYSSAANTIVGLTKDANATRYLSNTGAGNNPAWAQVDLTNGVTGVLPIANGGTNANAMADTFGVNYFDGTRIVTTAVGTATHVLTSNGVGVAPTFQVIPASGVTSLTGTANQITVSAPTGAVTLSTPATFIAPGSIASTTSITAGNTLTVTAGNLGVTAGTITASGAISSSGSSVSASTTVSAGTTVTGGTGVTATTGNVTATAGNLVATAGNVLLPTTTATTGMLQINATRFLHNFGGIRNTFVGETAGNLTASGANSNVGIGFNSLVALTSGDTNIGIGTSASGSVTSGLANIAIGSDAGSSVSTNGQNISIGDQANLFGTGSTNTIIGYRAANTASFTGSTNVVIGGNSGTGMNGAHSSNIYISNAGAAESNTIRIGTSGTGTGQQSRAFMVGVNGVTVTAAGNVVIADTSHQFGAVGAAGGTTLNSGAGTLTIQSTNTAISVNSGTGAASFGADAAAKTVTIGNTTGASILALQYGTGDMTLASATGTVMSALDTGEITYPLQPAFLAYLPSDDLNVTGNGATFTLGGVTALTEVFDQNGDFNTNGTFTAPRTGRYWLRFHILMGGITVAMTNVTTRIITSNRTYDGTKLSPGAAQTATNVISCEAIVLADMDASDTATFTISIANGAGDTADAQGSASPHVTYVCGELSC